MKKKKNNGSNRVEADLFFFPKDLTLWNQQIKSHGSTKKSLFYSKSLRFVKRQRLFRPQQELTTRAFYYDG
jgi:hypothetical protein